MGNVSKEGDVDFKNGKKPLRLIKQLIKFVTPYSDPDSLILDFFSGSATTAHAVMQLNAEDGGKRKYICVQLPEETPEGSEARKAGYATIPEIRQGAHPSCWQEDKGRISADYSRLRYGFPCLPHRQRQL